MIESSKALQELFYQYTHLPLGGKFIVCPYWMNKLKKGLLGPLGGKGTPQQIIQVVEEAAKKAGQDLNQMNEKEILAFMKRKRIGVDCSGFVFWMLNALDEERGGDGLLNDIPEVKGSFMPAGRADVKLLTSEKYTVPVELAEVRVGDVVRMGRGSHILIILAITRIAGEIKALQYAHSSDKTLISGVHLGEIKVWDESQGLEKQQWQEVTQQGENYRNYFFPQEGDGLRRLKIWN